MPGQLTCASCGSLNPAGSQFCATCDAYLLEGQPPARSPAEVLRDRQQPAGHRADEPRERPTEEVPALREPPRASGTSGRDDARSTSLPPIPLPADLRRCPTCGTANELTRTFCSRCGTRLIHGTVVPTTGMPTERSVNTRYVAVGAGLGIVLLVALAFIWSRGPEGPPADATATPTLTAGATTPPATPATADPPVTDPPASSPTASPTAESGCEAQTVTAPAAGEWRILSDQNDLELDARQRSNVLTFRAHRVPSSDGAATVRAEVVPLGDVFTRFAVQPPADGDRALVITFSEDVRLRGAVRDFPNFGRDLGRSAIVGVSVVPRERDIVAVAGVIAPGCFTMTWENGGDPTHLRVRIGGVP